MTQKSKGFTIVELLIVIVIIGILAALVIVVYNGIQQRAENTKTISALRQNIQAIITYETDKGYYPGYSPPTWAYSCLGDDYPAGTGYPVSVCGNVTNNTTTGGPYGMLGWRTGTNAAVTEPLREYFNGGSFPMPSTKPLDYNGAPVIGIRYILINSNLPEVQYMLGGNAACFVPSGTALLSSSSADDGGTTICKLRLPLRP